MTTVKRQETFLLNPNSRPNTIPVESVKENVKAKDQTFAISRNCVDLGVANVTKSDGFEAVKPNKSGEKISLFEDKGIQVDTNDLHSIVTEKNQEPNIKTSGVRLYMRKWIKKRSSVVHPYEEQPLTPQLLVKNGKFEVVDVDEYRRKEARRRHHINDEEGVFQKRGDANCCKKCFLDIQAWSKWYKARTHDYIPLFREKIKHIQGGYGTGVAAVFKFARWVILLNVLLSLFWLIILIIPAAVEFNYDSLKNISLAPENFLDGKGKLQYTWLFYGSYTYKINDYRIDYAYLVVGLITYFGSLLLILKSTVNAIYNVGATVMSRQDAKYPFSTLLLASWDFSIADPNARLSLARGISSYAKDMLFELFATNEIKSRTRRGKCLIIFTRTLAWIITLSLICGAAATIYFFMVKVTVAEFIITQTGVQIGKSFLEVYGLTVIFSLLNIILPFIIEKLTLMEGYEKGLHVIYVNVARVFLLRFLNIIALITSMYQTITEASFKGCGGTFIGQEFYKIMLLDTTFQAILQIVGMFGLYVIRGMKKREPAVSKVILLVVYRQALIWAGTFFCPVMPILGMISQTVVFLSNYLIIRYTCRAPEKRWNHIQSSVFFLTCLAVTLLFLIIPASTVLATDYVSLGTLTTELANGTIVRVPCGPFGQRPPIDIFNEAKNTLPRGLDKIANWITSAAVLPALVILSIIIYIQQLRYSREKTRVAMLQREQEEIIKRNRVQLMRSPTRKI